MLSLLQRDLTTYDMFHFMVGLKIIWCPIQVLKKIVFYVNRDFVMHWLGGSQIMEEIEEIDWKPVI